MPINPADRLISNEELIALFTDPPAIPERTAPAFMFDEGTEQEDIATLRARLHIYITTVQEQGLAGEDSDFRVLAHARQIACTLVTRDKHLRALHNRLGQLGLTHAGILYVRFSRTPTDLSRYIEDLCAYCLEKDTPNLLHHDYWKV